MENKEQHVDWAGLVYYDAKIKEYINSSTASKEEQVQLRSDLEQLEQLLTTLTMSFATDKDHIYKHINECMNGSATKEELQAALDAIREEIKTLTGVDLSDYATKDFVEQKLDDLQLSVELPDDLVTTEDIKDFVTREEVAEEIGKIVPPEVDLTSLATKEQLSAVEAKIPSVEGLASETYVDEKVVAVEDHESRIGILEHNYQAESQLHAQRFDSLQEQDTAIYKKIDQVEDHVSEKMDTVYAEKTFAGKTDLYNTNLRITNLEDNIPEIPTNISTFTNDAGYITSVPEEYVTDTELDAKGYLTEHQSLEGLATEQFVADEIAKLDCVSSTTVENIIEEKIEEVVTGGATVSSISYGTF